MTRTPPIRLHPITIILAGLLALLIAIAFDAQPVNTPPTLTGATIASR